MVQASARETISIFNSLLIHLLPLVPDPAFNAGDQESAAYCAAACAVNYFE